MDKNRIRGLRSRASWQRAAKPISIKASGGKSGGGALKAIAEERFPLLNPALKLRDEGPDNGNGLVARELG
jgi:hypothetical protein